MCEVVQMQLHIPSIVMSIQSFITITSNKEKIYQKIMKQTLQIFKKS